MIFKLFDNEVHANIGTDCQSVEDQNLFETNDCCCLQFFECLLGFSTKKHIRACIFSTIKKFFLIFIVFSFSSLIMGIRGLITFAESNQKCDFFESITLSNTNIVIDGNNLRFYLYNHMKGRNCAFGGEYKLYYDTVTKYFQRYVSVEFFGQIKDHLYIT